MFGFAQERIAAFLAGRASTCNSKLLSMISQRVASDPFDKVKKMIKDLIVRPGMGVKATHLR